MHMTTVGPQTSTTVPLVYDTDDRGLGGPPNMDGPIVGEVAYHQDGADNLIIEVQVQYGQANKKLEVFLVGGPAHSLSTGFVTIGSLVTNGAGFAAGVFPVPHGSLITSPFGPGYRTDHLDILGGVGDLTAGAYTAGAVNYFVCRQRHGKGEAAAVAVGVSAKDLKAQEGDPHGEHGRKSPDPH
jgi:hypothetical protein